VTTPYWERFTPLAEVTAAARLRDARGALPGPRPTTWYADADDLDPVAALLTGPLFWLGVVDVADAAPESGGEPTPHVRLSARGAWLLAQPDARPPADPDPAPGVIERGAPDVIQLSVHTPPVHLARLAPLCRWEVPDENRTRHQLHLDPVRLARAVARGSTPATLFQEIGAALGRAPSRRERQRWRQWMRAGEQVRIRPLVVLETRDAALMAQLRGRKRVRDRLGDVLAPTRAAVAP
jgi:hypothetical protein